MIKLAYFDFNSAMILKYDTKINQNIITNKILSLLNKVIIKNINIFRITDEHFNAIPKTLAGNNLSQNINKTQDVIANQSDGKQSIKNILPNTTKNLADNISKTIYPITQIIQSNFKAENLRSNKISTMFDSKCFSTISNHAYLSLSNSNKIFRISNEHFNLSQKTPTSNVLSQNINKTQDVIANQSDGKQSIKNIISTTQYKSGRDSIDIIENKNYHLTSTIINNDSNRLAPNYTLTPNKILSLFSKVIVQISNIFNNINNSHSIKNLTNSKLELQYNINTCISVCINHAGDTLIKYPKCVINNNSEVWK